MRVANKFRGQLTSNLRTRTHAFTPFATLHPFGRQKKKKKRATPLMTKSGFRIAGNYYFLFFLCLYFLNINLTKPLKW